MHYGPRPPVKTRIKEFGRRFEAYRLSRAIKQADLAERAGLSRSTVARIEAGRGGTLESMLRLLRALDLEDRFFALVPDATQSPLDSGARGAKPRQRVRTSRDEAEAGHRWTWGDET